MSILPLFYVTDIYMYIYILEVVGKLEGKRLLRRPRHRWVHNIKMNLTE
jgi:hypothetical protein